MFASVTQALGWGGGGDGGDVGDGGDGGSVGAGGGLVIAKQIRPGSGRLRGRNRGGQSCLVVDGAMLYAVDRLTGRSVLCLCVVHACICVHMFLLVCP